MSFSEEGFNYWYYENKKDNRFDKVVKSGNTILCYRSIDTLCFYPKESGAKFSYSSDNSSLISLPVNKIRESGIYLAIISWEQQPNDKRKELQRDWLHVVFH